MLCPYCNGTGHLAAPTLGACLRAARNGAGLSQEQLAQAAMISRAQVANIEADRSDVPFRTLLRLADSLNVSVRDLVPDTRAEPGDGT